MTGAADERACFAQVVSMRSDTIPGARSLTLITLLDVAEDGLRCIHKGESGEGRFEIKWNTAVIPPLPFSLPNQTTTFAVLRLRPSHLFRIGGTGSPHDASATIAGTGAVVGEGIMRGEGLHEIYD